MTNQEDTNKKIEDIVTAHVRSIRAGAVIVTVLGGLITFAGIYWSKELAGENARSLIISLPIAVGLLSAFAWWLYFCTRRDAGDCLPEKRPKRKK